MSLEVWFYVKTETEAKAAVAGISKGYGEQFSYSHVEGKGYGIHFPQKSRKVAVVKKATVTSVSLDPSAIIDKIFASFAEQLDSDIGPNLVAQAKELCPVGKDEPTKPRKSSFERVTLRTSLPARFGRTRAQAKHFEKVRAGTEEVNPATDAEFFQGVGANKDRTPTHIAFIGGGVKGRFSQHGRLKESIRWDGTERESDYKLVGTASANTDYAYYVHEGHGTKGGGQVAGRPFLYQGLMSVIDRIKDLDPI